MDFYKRVVTTGVEKRITTLDYIVARIWHGKVPKGKAEAYRDFLVRRAVPDYESVEGSLGVDILMRE